MIIDGLFSGNDRNPQPHFFAAHQCGMSIVLIITGAIAIKMS